MPPTASSPSLRQGFSLVELMVVIAIILAIMGIGFGAVMAAQRDTPLASAAVLTADFLRQARATSIALASPVEIRIEEVDGRVTISGITNRPVFDLHFGRDPVDGEPRGGSGGLPPLPGIAGYCWEMGEHADGPIGPFPLDRRRNRLMANAGDGFHLEFWLRPTVVPAPGQGDNDPVLPIIHIGSSDDWRDPDNAWLAFVLRARTVTVQQQELASGNAGQVQVRHWMPVVYLGDQVISGVQLSGNLHPTSGNPLDPNDRDQDVIAPVTGGRWVHYAVSYDGERVHIRQDGRALTTGMQFDADGQVIEVSDQNGQLQPLLEHGREVGTLPVPEGDLSLYLAGEGGIESPGCQIDLLRLVALGTDRPALIPGQVMLDPPGRYRIVFDGPQMRFEGPSGNRTISFILRSQEMTDAALQSRATVQLSSTGRVGINVESRN